MTGRKKGKEMKEGRKEGGRKQRHTCKHKQSVSIRLINVGLFLAST